MDVLKLMFDILVVIVLFVIAQSSSMSQIRRSTSTCGTFHTSGSSGLVFNGKETGRYEHPWKAALTKLSGDRQKYEYFCGGVLIDQQTVLTAAHCVKQTSSTALDPRDITVILGAHNISKRIETGRFNASVKSIKVHDKWNPSTIEFEGDIAAIVLSNPISFTEFIKPVCIANQQISTISNGIVTGWGIYDSTNTPSSFPRGVELPIMSDRDCLKKSPGLLPILAADLFCAGKSGAGVCKGDSGSGFYVKYKGQFYLRGLVSSSTAGPCVKLEAALYLDILKNLDFIGKFSKVSNQMTTTKTSTVMTATSAPRTPTVVTTKSAPRTFTTSTNVRIQINNWKQIGKKSNIPDNSVLAGYDKNRNKVYVGRYKHGSQGWVAVKIVDRPQETSCYFSYNSTVFQCTEFQILSDSPPTKYQWIKANGGKIPPCGVLTQFGFGIGRATIKGEITVGRIHQKNQQMYAPYALKEHLISDYEALVEKNC